MLVLGIAFSFLTGMSQEVPSRLSKTRAGAAEQESWHRSALIYCLHNVKCPSISSVCNVTSCIRSSQTSKIVCTTLI